VDLVRIERHVDVRGPVLEDAEGAVAIDAVVLEDVVAGLVELEGERHRDLPAQAWSAAALAKALLSRR
jgi:hypothetical protein